MLESDKSIDGVEDQSVLLKRLLRVNIIGLRTVVSCSAYLLDRFKLLSLKVVFVTMQEITLLLKFTL